MKIIIILNLKKSTNHKIINQSKITDIDSLIFKNIYGIEFAHELSDKYTHNQFQNKIINRIHRFLNLDNPIFY